MEASHEKWFTPVFHQTAKKKSQGESSKQESSAGKLPGEMRPWLVAWQCDSVICFGVWFVGLGPSQVFPSGQEEEELKKSSPSDKATQTLPLWKVNPSLFGAGMLVPRTRAAGPGPGWALGWLCSGLTSFQQLLQERNTSQMRFHLSDRHPSSAKLSVFASSPSALPSSSHWQLRIESRFLGAVWHQANLKDGNQRGWEVDSL